MLSRTDSIGDVILTLPFAGLLKRQYPDVEILFLGRAYTGPIVKASVNVDHFIDWDTIRQLDNQSQIDEFKKLNPDIIFHIFPVKEIARIAKKAGIGIRVGTTGRLYHWGTCNRLVRFSRKRSDEHESQLNFKLLKPFGLPTSYPINEMSELYGLKDVYTLTEDVLGRISKNKFNLILHPMSKGSAREWGLDNFDKLIKLLPVEQFQVFITGTKDEGSAVRARLVEPNPGVIDMTGKLKLDELLSFISNTDGLVAASTGPLHIAAALGKYAIGIYPPIKPMHPGRWAPIGKYAYYTVLKKECDDCRKSNDCECIRSIAPGDIRDMLLEMATEKLAIEEKN